MKFRKKPVIIDAIQFDGTDERTKRIIIDLQMPHGSYNTRHIKHGKFYIHTLEGTHEASIGDWIIKGVKGEFYPCKPDIFEMTYEQTEDVEKPNPTDGTTQEK